MNLNKVYLIGRTTKEPELKALPSGTKVANFSLATNRIWKDKDGAKQEDTTFHNIVAFGKTAEVIGEYVQKGQEIMVEGRIQNRSWEGDDGVKKYRSEVMLDNFQFGARAGSSNGEGSTPTKRSSSYSNGKAKPKAQKSLDESFPTDSVDYPEENINADDIPF